MFKCTDCSKIFEKRPDFCDCGNDTFEKIAEPVQKQKNSGKYSFFSELKNRFSRVSLENRISGAIFVFLLILAAIPWMIPVKTMPQNTDKKPVPVKKEIPRIDTLWSTPQAQEEKIEEPEPVQERIIEVIKQVYVHAPQTKTAPASKPVSTAANKPVQKAVQKPVSTKNTAAKPKTSTVQKKPAKTAPQLSAQEKKELENYKGALRMALFNNLNVPSIQGSGDCAVEFNVDSSGKLTNRNFTYQSDNKSLNDAVYYMLMRVPRFNAPPASYKGEKIKLRFKFDNGSIEVSFI